jgi:hypothetical protein
MTYVARARMADPMEEQRDATSVTQPSGSPPDEGKAYDPSMTEGDEANIPPESDADPESDAEVQEA